MTHKKAAAYIRVSSEEQTEGWSLEGQEQQIREYAQGNGYEVVQVYMDETSGSKDKEKRPGLEQMLLDAHAGLFSAIIVIHTSRLFRNLALARRYKDLLRNKLNIEVLFINQPIVDANDPMAFVMETMNELFDEYYLHQLRFWTTLGKQTRAQRGLWNGTLPFGYVTGENGLPVEHPVNAAGLVLAFESYSTGVYSDGQIADLLNREGFRTSGNWGERLFTKDTVNRMLRNVFYLGFVKYKGELIPGQHPALISQELFDKCQEIRSRRSKRRRAMGKTKLIYVFSGLARCEKCGLTLRCAQTGSKGRWRYYRHTAKERGYECSVPDRGLRAEFLEDQWSEIVADMVLPSDWRQTIERLSGDAAERDTILRERERIQEKQRRLKQLYKDLMIEESEYRSSLEELQSQLSALVLPNSPQLIEAGEQLQSLGQLWRHMTLAEQREVTRVMLRAVHVDVKYGYISAIEPVPVFRFILTQVCQNLDIKVI